MRQVWKMGRHLEWQRVEANASRFLLNTERLRDGESQKPVLFLISSPLSIQSHLFLFFFLMSILLLINYLFLSVLGLWCYVGFSRVAKRGRYSLVAFHPGSFSCSQQGSRCSGFRSRISQALEHRLNSCGSGLSCSVAWGSSWIGTQPVSTALAGGFFTPEPPGKPQPHLFLILPPASQMKLLLTKRMYIIIL